MQYIDGDAAEFDDFRFGEFARPGGFVDVASDCGYRRDVRKFYKNLGLADVTRVNDVFGPA
jgi:hypothetical protein